MLAVMSDSEKRPLAGELDSATKERKSISFSISSILGHTDPTHTTAHSQGQRGDMPLVSIATAPQFSCNKDDGNYSAFKSALHYRACSTPETDGFPSPTFDNALPLCHNDGPAHDNFIYRHDSLTAGYAGVPRRPSFTRFQPYRRGSLDSLGDSHHNSTDNTTEDLTSRLEMHSQYTYHHNSEPTPQAAKRGYINQTDNGLDSLGESYNNSPSPMKCRKKKTRTVFSRNQIYQLESAFDMKRYLSTVERSSLASRLQLSETQVKIWFQNRRNKWKRQISGEMDEIPLPAALAHMPGLISPTFSHQIPSAYPSMVSPGDELIRRRLGVPSLYSQYTHESMFRTPLFKL